MRLSTYGQFGGGFGQVAGDNRTDAIRKSKEKLEEEKKKGEGQAKPEEKDPKLNKKGKPKKKKSPSTPDEIRAKNEDKQNKFEEKQSLKKDIKAAKREGKQQKDARKAEKQGQKAADAEVKEQQDLANRSVTERPPAGYSDASNPDAYPTVMPNGQRLIRDEQNMQYIDVDTGERMPFGPNETAAMKTIINRRVSRKQAGASNQERVGPDGKIRMDQYDAELLAKARKADMQAGNTNTRGTPPAGGDNGEAPQRWQSNGAMGPTSVGDSFPDDLDSMSTSQMQKVSDLIGRRVKGPDGQWYSIKNQQQAIDFLNGRGNAPTGDLTDTTAEEKPGPDQQDVMPPVDDPMGEPPAQKDAPNRVNPDSFEDPKGELVDSPFPHYERAPEGNEIGGTRFKNLDQFLEWEREEKRRNRMRPGGGMQRERDAMDGGPLYSDKSDMDRWKEREVGFQAPKEVTESDIKGTREELDISLEDRIDENLRNGLIDSKEAKRLKGLAGRNPEKAEEELSRQNRERIAERKYGNSGGMFSVPSEQQPSRSEMLGENPTEKMGPEIELGPSREARGLQMDGDNVQLVRNENADAGMAEGQAKGPEFIVSPEAAENFERMYPDPEKFVLTQENFFEVAARNGYGHMTDEWLPTSGYNNEQLAALQTEISEKERARLTKSRIAAMTADNLLAASANNKQSVPLVNENGEVIGQTDLPNFVTADGSGEIHFDQVVDAMAQRQREMGMQPDAQTTEPADAAKVLLNQLPPNVPYESLPTIYKEAIQALSIEFLKPILKKLDGLRDQRIEGLGDLETEMGPRINLNDPAIQDELRDNWYRYTNSIQLPYSTMLQNSFDQIFAEQLDNTQALAEPYVPPQPAPEPSSMDKNWWANPFSF